MVDGVFTWETLWEFTSSLFTLPPEESIYQAPLSGSFLVAGVYFEGNQRLAYVPLYQTILPYPIPKKPTTKENNIKEYNIWEDGLTIRPPTPL